MFSFQTKKNILRAILFKKNPYYVQYYINGVCNLKCKQCNIVETNSGIGELSIEQIKVFAKNLRLIGGGIVLLTGGEPFMRKDIDQVAKAFIDEKIDVRLQTAGIAKDEQLRKCYEAGARDLNISLDSLDANKQDYINSVPGSWDKAIDAIERVSEIFRGNSAICSLGCVLSRFNYKEIPSILEFATRIGWYLSLVPVHIAPQDSFFGFRSYEDNFRFRPEDYPELEKVMEKVIQMKREGYLLFDAESFLQSSLNFIKTNRPEWRHKGKCDSPNLYFAVRPNGDFTTCCDYTIDKPPSLIDPRFPAYYRSGKIQEIADPIVSNCSGCHYGSYPEVTLSVRDKKALFQRVFLVLNQKKKKIADFEKGELKSLIQEIKDTSPTVYNENDSTKLGKILDSWKNPDSRKQIIKEDIAKRKSENRIRKPSRPL